MKNGYHFPVSLLRLTKSHKTNSQIKIKLWTFPPPEKKTNKLYIFLHQFEVEKKNPPKIYSSKRGVNLYANSAATGRQILKKNTAFNAELAGARGRPRFRRKIKPTPKARNCWHLMTHPKHCQTVRFRCNTHIERRARERSRAGSGEQSWFVFALGLELELNLYWRNYIYL